MRRILLLVTVALVMAAMMVALSGVASASHESDPNAVCTINIDVIECVAESD